MYAKQFLLNNTVIDFDSYLTLATLPSGILSGSEPIASDISGSWQGQNFISASEVTPNLPNGTVSGSSQVVLNDADKTGFDTDDVSEGSTNQYFTNARVKTRLDAETVVSGSAQIVSLLSNQATDFGTGRVSADNFGDSNGGSTFTGSFEGDGSGLTGLATNLSISGSNGNDTVDLINNALTFAGTTNEIETAVTDNTVTIGLPNDVTIGNGYS